MALGEITKQLAEHAIRNVGAGPAAAGAPADSLGSVMIAQLQAMQKALKEDEELVVLLRSGPETLRVVEMFVPSCQMAVLTAIDGNRNASRILAPFETLQLVCRVAKVPPAAKPARLALILPKGKPE